jgi:hypothetical protein
MNSSNSKKNDLKAEYSYRSVSELPIGTFFKTRNQAIPNLEFEVIELDRINNRIRLKVHRPKGSSTTEWFSPSLDNPTLILRNKVMHYNKIWNTVNG